MAIVPQQGHAIDSRVLREFRLLSKTGAVRSDALSRCHPDGWGIVGWEGGEPLYLGRQPSDAFSDPEFDRACAKLDGLRPGSHIIAHVRKASPGYSVSLENTHPFLNGRWAFAHNGSIRYFDKTSITDSERFFGELMRRERRGSLCMVAAIEQQVKLVHERYPDSSSITFLLSDGTELYAYRDYREYRDYGKYYTMYHATVDGVTVVSQERFFEADWHEVGNRQLLRVSASGQSLEDLSV